MLTMYSTSWCGYCHRLKSQLDREGIAVRRWSTSSRTRHRPSSWMSVNGGNQTVPTLRFDDGSALTNPTIIQVKQHLAALIPCQP